VKLQISNHTRYVCGGHATTSEINAYVNARLGNYGSAVESVWITLIYPSSSPRGDGAPGFDKMIAQAPRVTFFRAKRKIDVRVLCNNVRPKSIEADEHLTCEEAQYVVNALIAALELIQPRIRDADQFDYEAFLADAKTILSSCPADIAKWLRRV
jgi:hypothetical protein